MGFLVLDDWNDMFQFRTLFWLIVFDESGQRLDVGPVKIGQFGLGQGQSRPSLPLEFKHLPPLCFSLGQQEAYYETLNLLEEDTKNEILSGLRDVAYDLDLFDKILDEEVTRTSLLRTVSADTVTGRFNRLAHGDAKLTSFAFTYTFPESKSSASSGLSLEFKVTPDSRPPTNLHVLIGSNGTGKSLSLIRMARALSKNTRSVEFGWFQSLNEGDRSIPFTGLVYVAFSAFDVYMPPYDGVYEETQIRSSYIGLQRRKKRRSNSPNSFELKNPLDLATEFCESVERCRNASRVHRWREALRVLESDPIFADVDVASLSVDDRADWKNSASTLFSELSSGHKVVLLTTTRLVELTEERTLILFDEPESHLHPPLLAALIRVISNLLAQRNGVAIIATHSPVVLQEVPKSCVWILSRFGEVLSATRPNIETFGENVGVLTREAFGLEVTNSGFYRMVRDSVSKEGAYSTVLDSFGKQLGAEAKAIAQALVVSDSASKDESQ